MDEKLATLTDDEVSDEDMIIAATKESQLESEQEQQRLREQVPEPEPEEEDEEDETPQGTSLVSWQDCG